MAKTHQMFSVCSWRVHIFSKASSKQYMLWKALYKHYLFLTASSLAGGLSGPLHGGNEGTGGLGLTRAMCANRSVLLVVSFSHNRTWLFRDFDHNVVDILSVPVLLSVYDDCYDGWCCPHWLFVYCLFISSFFVIRVQLSLIDKCDWSVKNCTKYIFSNTKV